MTLYDYIVSRNSILNEADEDDEKIEAMLFSRAAVTNSLMDKLRTKFSEAKTENKVDAGQLQKRLSLIMP